MEMKVELTIQVREEPFTSDTSVMLWLERHLPSGQQAPLVTVTHIRIVGPRRNPND